MKSEPETHQSPSHASSVVRVRHQDFQRAIEFYRSFFNCCLCTESSVLHESDGHRIILVRDDFEGDPARLRSTPRRGPIAEFVVKDFDERVRDLTAAGCCFARDPTQSGVSFQFVQMTDPFEHLWMLRRFDDVLHSNMKSEP